MLSGPVELADHQRRVVDLRHHDKERQREPQRRRARELEGGRAAAHLDAEGIAADGLGCAVLEAPRLMLALTPGRNLRLGARGGIEPQAGPGDGEHQDQSEGQEQRPAPTAAKG